MVAYSYEAQSEFVIELLKFNVTTSGLLPKVNITTPDKLQNFARCICLKCPSEATSFNRSTVSKSVPGSVKSLR